MPHAPASAHPALHGVRVLVVDDEPMNRLVAVTILRRAGAEVEEADGGEAAIDQVRQHTPHVVLMDVLMPGMDGVDAMRAIRMLDAGRTVPIIAVTASDSAKDRAHLLDAGMADFLGKPFEVEELERMVARWVLPSAVATSPFATRGAPRVTQGSAADLVASVPVLDRVGGVRRFAGDAVLYDRQLHAFCDRYRGTVVQIATAIRGADRVGGAELVHALSGAGATLGARRVHAVGRLLEVALGGADPLGRCEQLCEQLQREFLAVEDAVHR